MKARRRFKKKTLVMLFALTIITGFGIGGTLAWLTDTTPEVENAFTVGNIDIDLSETTGDEYKMIPGWVNDKNPKVTIQANSEDCWVFIKVEKTSNLDAFIRYAIDLNNWTRLESETEAEVYYCYAKDITADRSIKILAAGEYEFEGTTYSWGPEQVLTKPDVTKEMMDALDVNGALPKLTFTAYASQYYKTNDVAFEPAEAWDLVKESK